MEHALVTLGNQSGIPDHLVDANPVKGHAVKVDAPGHTNHGGISGVRGARGHGFLLVFGGGVNWVHDVCLSVAFAVCTHKILHILYHVNTLIGGKLW